MLSLVVSIAQLIHRGNPLKQVVNGCDSWLLRQVKLFGFAAQGPAQDLDGEGPALLRVRDPAGDFDILHCDRDHARYSLVTELLDKSGLLRRPSRHQIKLLRHAAERIHIGR